MASRDAFGCTHEGRTGRLSWKLRRHRASVSLQIAAHKEPLTGSQLIVELSNVGIEPGRSGSRPCKATSVEAVASGGIRIGVSIESCERIRIFAMAPRTRTGAIRIHARHVCRAQGDKVAASVRVLDIASL